MGQRYQNVVYSIAAIIVLMECCAVEFLTVNLLALLIVFIADVNLMYLLWKMDKIGDYYNELEDEE